MRKKKTDWSVLRYLVYFTQVGITMVTPPLFLALGAVWLRDRFGWGNGIVIAGILLGVAVAAVGLRDFMRLTERKAWQSEREDKKP